MSILSRLFKRRRCEKKDVGCIKDITVDRKTGKVTGYIPLTVNGKTFAFNVETSLSDIDQAERRSKDPDSCEREPNADEVKLPIDFDITSLDCSTRESEQILMIQNRATIKGFNNFVVPHDVFERAKKK